MTMQFPFLGTAFPGFEPTDLLKGLATAAPIPLDLGTFIETQRKNMQALSDAHHMMLENLQVIAHWQGEIFSDLAENQSRMTQDLMAEGTPEEKITRQSEMIRKMYEKSTGHLREMADLLSRSGQDTADIINRRVSASLAEMESSVKKSTHRKTA